MTVRFTRSYAQALGPDDGQSWRFTRSYAQVMGPAVSPTSGERRFTKAYAQVLSRRFPDFSWVDDMFKPVLFPFNTDFNSIASPKFESDDISVDSGHSSHNARWEQPLIEYDLSFGQRSLEQIDAIVSFHRIMQGTVYAFLFQDNGDFTSTHATRFDQRRFDEPSALDQVLGTGDDNTTTFQLRKSYSLTRQLPDTGTEEVFRKITRPQYGTVKISVNGNELTPSEFEVDYETGIVTLDVAPDVGEIVRAGFKFWVPVRFAVKQISYVLEQSGWGKITNLKLVEVRPGETQ